MRSSQSRGSSRRQPFWKAVRKPAAPSACPARAVAPPPPPCARRGTGGGRRDPEAAEGDVIAGLFVQPRRPRRPSVIRPLRRGVGGPRGTLSFQPDRGAAAEHVDPGPEEAHAGLQAVRPSAGGRDGGAGSAAEGPRACLTPRGPRAAQVGLRPEGSRVPAPLPRLCPPAVPALPPGAPATSAWPAGAALFPGR